MTSMVQRAACPKMSQFVWPAELDRSGATIAFGSASETLALIKVAFDRTRGQPCTGRTMWRDD
jgi:hypothetical protein